MRAFLALLTLLTLLTLTPPALAAGPGPGPVPDPWTVNGNSVNYPGGVVAGSPAGGGMGSGTFNGLAYYQNGVLVSGMPNAAQGHLLCNLTSGSQVPTDCSWNAFASLAIGTTANSLPFFSGGVWGEITTGTSVINPGTGTLEATLPIQTITGTSHPFVTADLFQETRRSNSGTAMTDTFPAIGATGLINGTKIVYTNADATATATITAGSGTTMSNGTGSETVGPGRAIQYSYDAPSTEWRRTLNTGTALLGPNNLSDLSNIATARANLIPSGTITNAQLVNTSITVNSQTCTLGAACTITASAGTITVLSTAVASGAANGLLYNQGGLLGNLSPNNNGVLVTSGSGVPSISTTLPSGIAATNMALTTPAIGAATGTSLALGGATLSGGVLAVNAGLNSTAIELEVAGNGNLSIGSDASGNASIRSQNAVNLTLGVGANNWFTLTNAGAITHVGTTTLSAALTYGGVTLNNAVTGTGNMVLGTSPTLTTPALGVPTSLTLTNATGLPIAGISGLGTGVATPLGNPVSGSGNFCLSTSCAMTTPSLGVATATSINKVAITAPATSATLTLADGTTLSETTSTSVGKGQYLATSTNDNATAGNIGEYISSTVLQGSAVPLSSSTSANITSISLTAGDWDVTATIDTSTGASTDVQQVIGWASTTSATVPTLPNAGSTVVLNYTSGSHVGFNDNFPVGTTRISLASTTTVFLSIRDTFGVSTQSAFGFIGARRAR